MLLVNVIFDWCGWKNTATDDRRLWCWILNIMFLYKILSVWELAQALEKAVI
jgi:hypothetical protein